MHDLSEYQPTEVISEKDGEGSPNSKGKSKRVKSPKKTKFILPNLKLAFGDKMQSSGLKFKEFWSNIHGVTPVVKQIKHTSKHLLRYVGNISMSKNRSENVSPKFIESKESKTHSKTPQEFEKDDDFWKSSLSPWDRLSKPKFISSKVSLNNSMVYGDEKNKLPSLQGSKINIWDVKNLKKNKKLNDPFSDSRLNVYLK